MPKDLYLTPATYQCFARTCLPVALVVIFILALIPPSDVPLATLGDKVLHMTAFFILAGIIDAARPDTPWSLKKMAWLTSYGIAIEIAQGFHPLRHFGFDDMVADVAGQLIYFALVPLIKQLPVLRLRWQHQ